MLYFTFTSIGFLIIYRVLMVDFLSILITTILNRLCWKGYVPTGISLAETILPTNMMGKDKKGAVVFAIRYLPRLLARNCCLSVCKDWMPVAVPGEGINLMPGANSSLQGNGELFSGEYLMTVGLNIFTGQRLNSRVIEVVAE